MPDLACFPSPCLRMRSPHNEHTIIYYLTFLGGIKLHSRTAATGDGAPSVTSHWTISRGGMHTHTHTHTHIHTHARMHACMHKYKRIHTHTHTHTHTHRYEASSATVTVDRMASLCEETGRHGFHFVDEVCCLLSTVCPLLSAVCCLLSPISCLLCEKTSRHTHIHTHTHTHTHIP
jgi:hypothetical protein